MPYLTGGWDKRRRHGDVSPWHQNVDDDFLMEEQHRHRPRYARAPAMWMALGWMVFAVCLSVSGLNPTIVDWMGIISLIMIVVALISRFYAWADDFLDDPRGRPREAPSDWRTQWRASRRRFDALRVQYAAYECDPLAVLRLPGLADVTVASTARFVDAFAQAQGLHSEHEEPAPPKEYATSYNRAVERAWQTWHAAKDAATRIRLSRLSPQERARVQRVVKLLTWAEDTDNDGERRAAYAKARAELAKLEHAETLRIPYPALAALDASSRSALPEAGSTAPTRPESSAFPDTEPS